MNIGISSVIRLIVCVVLSLYSESLMAQGKIARPKIPHNTAASVSFERTDAFGPNDIVVRAKGANGKWGAVDRNNQLVIPLRYSFLCPFFEGVAAASKMKDGKYALIDSEGKELTEFIYDFMNGCNEGRICVGIDGKYGFLDKTGKVIVPLIYSIPSDAAYLFKNGKAKVSLNGESFYIDYYGNRL